MENEGSITGEIVIIYKFMRHTVPMNSDDKLPPRAMSAGYLEKEYAMMTNC